MLFLLQTAMAQVRFDLTLLPDQVTYLVRVVSNQTWTFPNNKVGSLQVVLRHKADVNFAPQISSLVNGLTWVDNAHVHLDETAEFAYACIALEQRGISALVFEKDKPINLFTFTNTAPCLDVELVYNSDPDVVLVREAGFNITQNISILGANGNAFSGFMNREILCEQPEIEDCSPTAPKKPEVTPNPAETEVQLVWKTTTQQMELLSQPTVVIFDALGRDVWSQVTTTTLCRINSTVNVSDLPAGMYFAKLLHQGEVRFLPKQFVVVH